MFGEELKICDFRLVTWLTVVESNKPGRKRFPFLFLSNHTVAVMFWVKKFSHRNSQLLRIHPVVEMIDVILSDTCQSSHVSTQTLHTWFFFSHLTARLHTKFCVEALKVHRFLSVFFFLFNPQKCWKEWQKSVLSRYRPPIHSYWRSQAHFHRLH